MAPLKKSVVWKYFDKKSNDIVTCKICNKDLRFSNSTTNMKSHLRCKNHSFLKLENKEEDEHEEVIGASVTLSVGESEIETSKRMSGEVLNYQKLVVPVSMRSVYWKCFGFPASENGEILTRMKIVCLLCKNVLSYNRNTSNLRMHLQNKHVAELVQLESASPRKVKDNTLQMENKTGRKKREGNMFSTSFSGSLLLSNDNALSHSNVGASSAEDYEAGMHLNSEIDVMDSSHVNIVYSNKVNIGANNTTNKSNVDLMMPGGEQSCTIESLHPFMIPIETKSVSDAVTEFIIMDMQLPDIVEGRGFQRLIATLKSPCEIPSKSKLIEEVIPRVYDGFKESVQEIMQNIKTPISLCVEEWEAITGDSYVTFSVSYQQEKDDLLLSKVLSTVHCHTSSDSSFWEMIFENMLEEWNLKLENMKVVVCATMRQELLDTLTQKGLVVVPCLVHTLQEVCTKVCLNQADVDEILRKCRMLIYLIYKTNNALAALRIQDHLMMLEDTPLVSDNQKVWLSTYSMLEAVLARRQVISTILDNIDSSSYDKDLVSLSEHDWSLIEDVVAVLEPFKVTVMTLSEERNPLVSLMKPLIWQLLSSHLKSKDEDSVNVQIFKSALKTLLSEKYSDVELNQLLDIATTLDPRFKSLPNMVEETKASLDGPIKDSLTKFIEESPKEIKPIVENAVPEKKKPRLSGMVMMLGEMCPATPSTTSMSCEDRANLELVQYQSEATAPLDQCPMAWWAHISTKCPHLSRLAAQYTCIPAAAVPSCRIALDTQLTYVTKRANLFPEIIDRIIFLNANHSL